MAVVEYLESHVIPVHRHLLGANVKVPTVASDNILELDADIGSVHDQPSAAFVAVIDIL
jgi:hypothetical protein